MAIRRDNKRLVDLYIGSRRKCDHLDEKSLKLEWAWSKYYLTWADERPFRDAPKIDPTLPEYVMSLCAEGKGTPLSPEYRRKLLDAARHFFTWLKGNIPGYRVITDGWINTIKLGRQAEVLEDVENVSLGEMLAIARAPVTTLMEERIRAGASFLYLSGMRVNAFVSLPIRAVNIPGMEVQQLPSLGVRTKFKKAAITFLLDIPELISVVRCWDNRVRSVLPLQSPWFAPISPLTGELDSNCHEPGLYRDACFRQDLQEWLAKVGGIYHSPHKFRRGHAVFCLTNASDYADMQAAMANLMHESMAMTEKYARLKRAEAKKRITSLGKTTHLDVENSDIITELEKLVARLKGANS